jgi:hypothetical protein
MEEAKRSRLIASYQASWDLLESFWVREQAHNFTLFGVKNAEDLDWDGIQSLIKAMRSAGYDEWCGVKLNTNDTFTLYRNRNRAILTGKQLIRFTLNDEKGMNILGIMNNKEYSLSLNPIALNTEIKVLLDMLKTQPID